MVGGRIKSTGTGVARPVFPSAAEIKRAAEASARSTPPTKNPGDVYPEVPGLDGDYDTFRLIQDGLTPQDHRHALEVARRYHNVHAKRMMGFQGNLALDYSKRLSHYLDTLVNNVGDPFSLGSFNINSKFMEQAVLDYFASLWNAKWPHDVNDPESYWGFGLTMGSTEGNLYGMWNARDYLGGKVLLIEESQGKVRPTYRQSPLPHPETHCFSAIAFYSEDTHYSLTKVMTIMGIKTFYEVGTERYPNDCPLPGWQGTGDWPREVPSNPNGEGSIDIDALAVLVEFFASKGYPIIVNFNYGTTFKGAYDDVEAAGNRLVPILKKYGLYERNICYDPNNPDRCVFRHGFWFHVDGALGAAYMPFIKRAYDLKLFPKHGPKFDFELDFVSSISMSGHKWIGSPVPCGVYLTRTKYQLQPPDIPEYTGTPDTTFAGSRSGLSALLLWDHFARNSYDELTERALQTQAVAEYMESSLKELGKRLKTDLWVRRTPLSLTVLFKRPREEIVSKYTLSNDTEPVDGVEREYSHIYAMEHVTFDLVDELIHDLELPGAFDPDYEPFELEREKLEGLAAKFRPGRGRRPPPELVKW